MYEYQKVLVDKIISTKALGLFVDMGLGKTKVMLEALHRLCERGEAKRVLVVAPLRVCLMTWVCEANKWGYTTLPITQFAGIRSKTIRTQDFEKPGLHLINPESLGKLLVMDLHDHYDVLVVDESTCFKNPSSARFKLLAKKLPFFKRRYIMTGTPIPNGYLDLWSQIYILDMGERLGKYVTHYRNEYFTYIPQAFKYNLSERNKNYINLAIKDITTVLKCEDCKVSLPPFNSIVIQGKLDKPEEDIYKKLKNDFVLTFENGDSINVTQAGALTNKLLQFCGGAVYMENEAYRVFHDKKLKMLRELLDTNGNNMLLAYNYKHEKARILHEFPEAREATHDNINLWNEGKVRLLIANPKSIGHGLNLQNGGHTVVWFSLTWDLEIYQQFNKRLHRGSQSHPVMCFHLCTCDIENVLLKCLNNKNITQESLLKALLTKVADVRITNPKVDYKVLDSA